MTPDELEHLVLAGDSRELQLACEGLDEAERAKLSSAAQKLQAQLTRWKAGANASPRLTRFFEHHGGDRWQHWGHPVHRRATLALFAVGPLSAVRKADALFWRDGDEAVLERVILDRRPAWLDDWIGFDLEREAPQTSFDTLRAWIRNGHCAKPEVDGYYRLFAAYMMRTRNVGDNGRLLPLSAQLLADPGLLDDIPGLFRVENIAFNTNSWLRSDSKDYESWPDALVKLVAQGRLDRDRLLDLAIEGLARDLKQNQLAGFHGLYGRLEPGPDVMLRHQAAYIGLLCHPVGHVAKFALDMLAGLEKRGGLDVEPVLLELQAVVSSGAKGTATAALKLASRVIAGQKTGGPAALAVVCEALRHAHADVQGQALGILEANAAGLDAERRATLEGALPFVAASNRARLSALVTGAGAEVTAAPKPARREGPWDSGPYRPISEDINAQTVLAPDERITPIATVDELLAAVLHAIELVDSPDEIERIIDAISRLAGERPDDFSARAAPALHRLENPSGATQGFLAAYTGPGLAFADLVWTWLTGRLHRTPDRDTRYYVQDDAFVPLIAHLRAIAERVAARRGQRLLSAPTHRGGWIDPVVWVARLQAAQGEREVERSMDLRRSLLRLAPDNRPAALERIGSLALPVRRIAAFALGGAAAPERGDSANYATWMTAARCRAPHADWREAFAPLGLEDGWPGGLRAARYGWRSFHEAGQYADQRWKHPKFEVTVTPDGPDVSPSATGGFLARIGQAMGARTRTDWAALPAAALSRRAQAKPYYYETDLNKTWVARWLIEIWPQNPGPAYMKAAERLTQRVDDAGSSWTPNFGFFHGLFQKGRPWLEPGHLLLCIGLIGKDADAKGLAVDALVEGIDGRMFDPARFAEVMARLSDGEWVKFNRLGDSLALVIAVSELHAAVVGDALQRWLPTLDLQQSGAFRLLEVLVEAQAIAGAPLSPGAREALAKVGGSGKAAKLAKQLLAA